MHIVALDIFSKTVYHKIIESVQKDKEGTLQNPILLNDFHMWLSLLCTETIEDAINLIKIFPFLKEVFMDMQEYTTHPEEAMNTFSEALRILDINTVNYMVDDMKAEIEAQKAEVKAQKAEVEVKNAEVEKQNYIIKELKNTINEQNEIITALKLTIDTLNTNFEKMKK